jgi:AcrR family transcriptional regulator
MTKDTKERIEKEAILLFTKGGYEALSMRSLAGYSGVGLSSIYYFFKDKDILLKEIFEKLSKELGKERAKLPTRKTAQKMLEDRVNFQFEHIEKVIFILKYYLHFRPQFLRLDSGYIPEKGYLHINEVIEKGLQTGEYKSKDPVEDAKVMAHAINGFLLEYFPETPKGKELKKVTSSISNFLNRAMQKQ